jgi:hypothetical protein
MKITEMKSHIFTVKRSRNLSKLKTYSCLQRLRKETIVFAEEALTLDKKWN